MNKSIAFKILREVPNELKKGEIVRMGGEDFKVTSINKIEWVTSHMISVVGWCKKVNK